MLLKETENGISGELTGAAADVCAAPCKAPERPR